MASPQLEDGYTRIANELLEALCQTRIGGQELRVVLFVLRKTYGYGKQSDQISYGQIGKTLGISRTRAINHVQALRNKNVLGASTNGNRKPLTIWLQKDHTKWLDSPKKLTVPNDETTPKASPGNKGDNEETVPNNGNSDSPNNGNSGSPNNGNSDSPNNGTHKRKKKEEEEKEQQMSRDTCCAPSDFLVDTSRKFLKHRADNLGEKLVKVTERKVVEGAKTLEKLERLDGFKVDEVLNVLRWAVKDDFWSFQLRSLSSLRNKSKNGETKFRNIYADYHKDGKRRKQVRQNNYDGSLGVVI